MPISMIQWRLARIENALAQHGLLEPLPVPFFRILLGPDLGYFVAYNGERRVKSNELDGPIFAEEDANRLVEALKNKQGFSGCKKIQADKIKEEYNVSTFDEVWQERSNGR